jgi:iron(III) transport system permease protein
MGVAALPLALPPLVGVLAFLFLYGQSGILPRLLQSTLQLASVPFAFEGIWAVWIVHVYSMYVYFYLFATAGLRSLDRALLESAADLGAGPIRTLFTVVLPHLRPAIVSASILVFMVSMASFTAPLLFAGTEQFLTLQIYNYKLNGDLALSAAVSTVLTLICLVFLLFLEASSYRRYSGSAAKGTRADPKSLKSGWARSVVVVCIVALLLFLLLPIGTIVLISFAREGSWTYQLLPSAYTFQNYTSLFTDPAVLKPILNSISMAAVATAANVVFGVVAALLIVRRGFLPSGLIRILAVMPFAIPGTVIALNMIVAFNAPSFLTGGSVLVGSFWILPLAYFIRHIPFVVRATTAALENYDLQLNEASSDLGASAMHTFRRVLLPAISPAVIAGSLLTFVTSLGEFVSSILLYIFDNRPISVEILSQLRLYDFGSAAAYSVFLMILIAAATLVVHRIGSREERLVTAAA